MPAIRWTLGAPDLRWRGAFAKLRPRHLHRGDVVRRQTRSAWMNGEKTAAASATPWRRLEADLRSERWPGGVAHDDQCVMDAGCVIGVGFWAARTSGGEGGERRNGKVAVGIVLLGLIGVRGLPD